MRPATAPSHRPTTLGFDKAAHTVVVPKTRVSWAGWALPQLSALEHAVAQPPFTHARMYKHTPAHMLTHLRAFGVHPRDLYLYLCHSLSR